MHPGSQTEGPTCSRMHIHADFRGAQCTAPRQPTAAPQQQAHPQNCRRPGGPHGASGQCQLHGQRHREMSPPGTYRKRYVVLRALQVLQVEPWEDSLGPGTCKNEQGKSRGAPACPAPHWGRATPRASPPVCLYSVCQKPGECRLIRTATSQQLCDLST